MTLTLGIIAALLAPLFWSFSNIFDQLMSKHWSISARTLIQLSALVTGLIILPLFFITFRPELPSRETWFWLAFVGLLETIYVFPYYYALRVADTSTVIGFYKVFGGLFTPTLAFIFLGEVLTLQQYVGFMIAISAGVYLSLVKRQSQQKIISFIFGPAVLLIGASTLMSNSGSVAAKNLVENLSWQQIFFFSELAGVFAILLFSLLPRQTRELRAIIASQRKVLRVVIAEQTCNALALGCFFIAITALPLTVVKAIATVQPFYVMLLAVVCSLVGWSYFSEDLSKRAMVRKLIAFSLIALGLTLILVQL